MTEKAADNVALIKRKIMQMHAQHDWSARLYARLRMILAPIAEIEGYVPRTGNILDLGCGSGIFANILAVGSPERRVFGVDIAGGRIETARKLSKGNPNLEFVTGDVNSTPFERYDAVTLIDLLHHMSYDEQDELLKKIYDKMDEDNVLIIKDLEKAPCWKYIFHYIQDTISCRTRLYFRSSGEMEGLLKKTGFQVETVSLAGGYPHPHILYKCRKTGNSRSND